jgi:hypothetical protein
LFILPVGLRQLFQFLNFVEKTPRFLFRLWTKSGNSKKILFVANAIGHLTKNHLIVKVVQKSLNAMKSQACLKLIVSKQTLRQF